MSNKTYLTFEYQPIFNKIFIVLLLIATLGCKNGSDCEHPFEDNRIELCLPSEEWKTEKFGEYVLFSNNLTDGTGLNATLISVTIKDNELNLNTENFRDSYFDELNASSVLGVQLLSKGMVEIDDKIFYDLEMNTTNGEVYDYLMFYKKGTKGYILRAIIPEQKRMGVSKKDYLEFFQSLKIK